MWAKVIYSFKSEFNRGTGEIADHSKTLISPPVMFTSLEEIQAYIEECEQKELDLENAEGRRLIYPLQEQLRRKLITKGKCSLNDV